MGIFLLIINDQDILWKKYLEVKTERYNFFDKDKIDKINNLKIELDVSFRELDKFLWSYARLDTDDIEKFIKFIMGSQYQDFFNENEEKLKTLCSPSKEFDLEKYEKVLDLLIKKYSNKINLEH